jgi:hypothetical protein
MQSGLRLIHVTRRRLAAAFTGSSLAGFVGLHIVHLAAGAATPIAYQFLCHIAR